MMSREIKTDFGRMFRAARDQKRISRAALSVRLGVSPKTIQSWEMGRTFIEDLSLIPLIESELGISVSDLIGRATSAPDLDDEMVAETGATYRHSPLPKAGPLALQFALHPVEELGTLDEKELSNHFVAIPVVKPSTVEKEVSKLSRSDILDYTVIPAAWAPRGGVLVACRMCDSAMAPMIPLGSIVILDRRPYPVEKALNHVMALFLTNKGTRIRRLVMDTVTKKVYGLPAGEGRRGLIQFREDLGDQVLARVIGVLARPE